MIYICLLIIKVASIPKERMQVYFIDNEEYFKRKDLLLDKNEKLLKDNDERMIFFTKGVIETVKKVKLDSRYYSSSWLVYFIVFIF